MRLPPPERLACADHQFLYQHDVLELHNPDASDFRYLTYSARLDLMLQLISRFVPRGRVLDVGCAQGNVSLALAENGYQVVALDLRHTFLSYLKLKYERGDLTCIVASAARLPLRPGVFDVVILGELLEHVSYPERLIADAAALLRPGGVLVATTPNGGRFHTGLPTLSAIADRQALQSREHRPDADGHLFLLTKRELVAIVRQSGLDVARHEFLGSPWITGRLKGRVIAQVLPVHVRRRLDRAMVRLYGWRAKICDGQVVVAVRVGRWDGLST